MGSKMEDIATEDSEVTDYRDDAKFITVRDDMEKKTDDTVTFERKDDIPKDRGWAWVILLAATLAMLLLIGVIKCSGILFVAFQERYHSSSAMTSLLSTVQNICQSLSSLLAMTFGIRLMTCRSMLFGGSIITCTAYVITSQATHFNTLLFSHGVLQGLGMGLMFPTALTMVSLYFEKRRGLANSTAVSGGAIGGFLFAPMITYLLSTVGYQGCLLILAGILLNGCVAAVLLRPTSFYSNKKREQQSPQLCRGEKESPLSTTNKTLSMDKLLRAETVNTELTKHINKWKKDSVHSVSDRIPISWLDASATHHLLDAGVENKRSLSVNDITKKVVKENELLQTVFKNPPSITANHSLISKSSINPFSKSIEIFVDPCFNSTEKFIDSPDDSSIKETTKQSNVIEIEKNGMFDEEKMSRPGKGKLHRNPLFWALLVQGSLICSGTIVTPIYIAPYAKDIGLTVDEVASLVTVLSCVDLFARVAVGYISDKGYLRRSAIVAIATLVIAFAASLLRFYTSYVILLGYAIVLGLLSGAYFSLYAVILIDYLTLDNFQTCIGIQSLVHGFSTAGVFYLVGYLRDVTGSYVVSHNVIGVSMVFGAIILFLLPVIERMKKQDKSSYAA